MFAGGFPFFGGIPGMGPQFAQQQQQQRQGPVEVCLCLPSPLNFQTNMNTNHFLYVHAWALHSGNRHNVAI